MLAITGLTHRYGNARVLDLPQWRLENGEHALLLGPSGSGKTSLLHIIAGILKPSSGKVVLAEKNIAAMDEAALDSFRGQHIGLVFQTFHLIGALSVIDNLLLAQYMAGMPEDKNYAMQLLENLAIAHLANTMPARLSHGQAQRVAIARSLANKPSLILADEPTSALDDANCKTVIELLLAQARDHRASLIVASHDMRLTPYFQQTLALEAL